MEINIAELSNKNFFRIAAILILSVLFMNACANNVIPVSGEVEAISVRKSKPTLVESAPTIEITATPEIVFTPTPDTRPLPDQWQSWPIILEVINRAKEIHAIGLEKGVINHSFSKIGDCQNVKES